MAFDVELALIAVLPCRRRNNYDAAFTQLRMTTPQPIPT
jgi:hypothetical protein